MGKKLFQITIEETISECFDIYANNIDEAIIISENKYKSGEFVLSPGTVTDRKISATNKDMSIKKEWIEF